MPDRPPRPTEVAEALTALREAAGMSASAVSDATRPADGGKAVAQSTITRYENGQQTPDREAMQRLLDVYRPGPDIRQRLLDLTREARPQHRRVVLHRSEAPRYQAEYRDLEQEAVRIRNFTATLAPGLLQTDDYARAVVGDQLTGHARDRWIAERRRRRDVVGDPRRPLEFVTTTGALAWNLGGPTVMAGQLARLDEVSRLGHVTLGVITPAVVAREVVTNNVDLYERADGRHTVIVGTSAGTSILTDDREVAAHAALLDRLAGLAVWGDQARDVLAEIARWYPT